MRKLINQIARLFRNICYNTQFLIENHMKNRIKISTDTTQNISMFFDMCVCISDWGGDIVKSSKLWPFHLPK